MPSQKASSCKHSSSRSASSETIPVTCVPSSASAPNSESPMTVEADTVVVAVSQSPNPLLPQSEPGLKTRPDGRLVVNPETGETSMPAVFAGGDIANDAGTVIAAMGDAKRAARAIHNYLKHNR